METSNIWGHDVFVSTTQEDARTVISIPDQVGGWGWSQVQGRGWTFSSACLCFFSADEVVRFFNII